MQAFREHEHGKKGASKTKLPKRDRAAPSNCVGADQGPDNGKQAGAEQHDTRDVKPPSLRITRFIHRRSGECEQPGAQGKVN